MKEDNYPSEKTTSHCFKKSFLPEKRTRISTLNFESSIEETAYYKRAADFNPHGESAFRDSGIDRMTWKDGQDLFSNTGKLNSFTERKDVKLSVE